jgi:NDP-sugar pyrophosphorylase family protein
VPAPLPTVCILAGGLGTRLGEIGRQRPKALVEVAGRPFVFHQLAMLAGAGAERVVLCVGWLGEQIEQTLGDRHGDLRIAYSYDDPCPCGTLVALRRALPLLGERFLVMYGDTFLRIDLGAFDAGWRASGLPGAMAVFRNHGRFGPSNVAFDGRRVTAYDKRQPGPDMTWIDYGVGGLSAPAVAGAAADDVADLYRSLAETGQLFGYAATERFYEIGTPEAVEEADRFLRTNPRAAS